MRSALTVKVDLAHPETAFSRCRDVISSGGIIAYPTDTFYGLGADPSNAAAVKRLFNIKGRTPDKPVLLLIKDAGEVAEWAEEITSLAAQLMRTHWPGPLTLVFKARGTVLRELTAGTDTIGLRVPGSELTRELLAYLGTALTGTSANASGGPNAQTAGEAEQSVGDAVDLILDGGMTTGGMPSTVVDVSAGMPKVIRQGAIPFQKLHFLIPVCPGRGVK